MLLVGKAVVLDHVTNDAVLQHNCSQREKAPRAVLIEQRCVTCRNLVGDDVLKGDDREDAHKRGL